MSTFKELQKKSRSLVERKLILEHLIDYIEGVFRGGDPYSKKVLLDENRVAVSDEAFADIVAELLQDAKNAAEELEQIMTSTVTPVKGASK